MEYIEHGDLENTLDEATNSSWGRRFARDVIKQVLEGLRVMHGVGMAHRDLKPQVASPILPIRQFQVR